jgi:hypothetical protein
MPPPSRLRRCLAGLALCLLAQAAPAQQFTYDRDERRATQSVSFGYTAIDFQYNGEGTPRTSFAFREPAYGVVYTRPNFSAAIAFGEQAAPDTSGDRRPLRLLDASITTWGEFFMPRRGSGGAARLFVPIALHSDYRRVSLEGEENSLVESFNVTVLGLGIGLGYEGQFGPHVGLDARALPIAGLAVRSFGDAAGTSYLVDTDLQLHLSRLVGRVGLTLGYGFRYQVWNGAASTLLAELTADLYDYRGSQHLFRVGVNW